MNDDNQYYSERPPAGSLGQPMGGFSPSSPSYQPLGAGSPPNAPQGPGYAPYPPGTAAPVRRDGTPVIVEVIGAIFGFYGIGWLMVGETTTGVLLLIAGLVWAAIVATGTVLTAGLGACCFVPLHAVFIAISAVSLWNHIKRTP
jgi:hypothetical protein